MTLSDPIADLLTRIRNAGKAEHRHTDIPWSNFKEAVVKNLKEMGFIHSYLVRKEGTIGTIRVVLKYGRNREPVLKGLKRISKPGARQYVAKDEIPYVLRGMGAAIITTSQGVMSGDEARKRGVGGEILCKVW